MKLETELDVGDVIWVPRVYPEMHRDSVVVDGKKYWSEDATTTYKAVAKQKIITEIAITITHDCLGMTYWGATVGDDETMTYSVVYRSTDPCRYFKTEQEALEFAKKLAKKEEPYYG